MRAIEFDRLLVAHSGLPKIRIVACNEAVPSLFVPAAIDLAISAFPSVEMPVL